MLVNMPVNGFKVDNGPAQSQGVRTIHAWRQVRSHVLSKIASGEWPQGSTIPPEQKLAVDLGCARATVNRALRDLADRGLVERRRKVGTRVIISADLASAHDSKTIQDLIEDEGMKPKYSLLSSEEITPDPSVSDSLELGHNEKTMFLRTAYTADGAPFCCESRWFNTLFLRNAEAPDFAQSCPNEWVTRQISLSDIRMQFSAAHADEHVAKGLSVEKGTPLLMVECLSSIATRPICFVKRYFCPQTRFETTF